MSCHELQSFSLRCLVVSYHLVERGRTELSEDGPPSLRTSVGDGGNRERDAFQAFAMVDMKMSHDSSESFTLGMMNGPGCL